MKRIAACIEYCGVNYHGWQMQKHVPSVQCEVERAISAVANEDIAVTAAGRTDTGVHGTGQVIHFDTTAQRNRDEWLMGVNTGLPDDVSLIWTQEVPPDFHARFKALRRSYRYVILNRRVSPSYLHGRVAWYHAKMDVLAMQEAAVPLLGLHDFSAFQASGCQSKNPVREVHALSLHQSGCWIWMDISASGFLQHMVRNIAGTLMRVGRGQAPVKWAREVLEGRDRTRGGITAMPDGLYFVEARYDERYRLPCSPPPCRFW